MKRYHNLDRVTDAEPRFKYCILTNGSVAWTLGMYDRIAHKHKYQDNSDVPRNWSRVIEATSPDEAELKLADLRDGTSVTGMFSRAGTRFYIGIIHFGATELIK